MRRRGGSCLHPQVDARVEGACGVPLDFVVALAGLLLVPPEPLFGVHLVVDVALQQSHASLRRGDGGPPFARTEDSPGAARSGVLVDDLMLAADLLFGASGHLVASFLG